MIGCILIRVSSRGLRTPGYVPRAGNAAGIMIFICLFSVWFRGMFWKSLPIASVFSVASFPFGKKTGSGIPTLGVLDNISQVVMLEIREGARVANRRLKCVA